MYHNNNDDTEYLISELNNITNTIIESQHVFLGIYKNWINQIDGINLYYKNKITGVPAEPVIQPELHDKRFNSSVWQDNITFDVLKQNYLACSELVNKITTAIPTGHHSMKRIMFFTQQIINAIAPTNIPILNPEIIQKTIESNGKNFVDGMINFIDDLQNNNFNIFINKKYKEHFDLGKDIANTEGYVIYENEILQLIQYVATTEEVKDIPILFIPPWINKFYIFDLTENNSLIKWMIDNGWSVFVVSWINPHKKDRHKSFSDYITKGIYPALEHIAEIYNIEEIHAFGYCLGGTLLATIMSLNDNNGCKIISATLAATLLDFDDSGDLSLFADDFLINKLSEDVSHNGFLPGSYIQTVFSIMRSNDMIWRYWIESYFLANTIKKNEMLFWNSDPINMSESMYHFLTKCLYKNNILAKKKLFIKNKIVDINNINAPIFILSAKEDHIAPWNKVYKSALMLKKNDITFVLSESGHVASIVNHPNKNKYGFWHNDKILENYQEWYNNSSQEKSSWWIKWEEWLATKHPIKKTSKINIKNKIEKAPGKYAKSI